MKKLLVVSVLMLALITANLKSANAIGVIIKYGLGIARNNDCVPGNGICFIIIITRTVSNTGLARSEAGSDIELVDGTAELKDGKLFITASQQLSEKARNKQGKFEFAIKEQGVKSQMVIDPAVAKELGVESLAIAPGKYEFNGNTLVLSVKSPRDPASGQASGRRSNIAIDESGVQTTTPKSTESPVKATYDQKVNKK
jgi:hypothetical protein